MLDLFQFMYIACNKTPQIKRLTQAFINFLVTCIWSLDGYLLFSLFCYSYFIDITLRILQAYFFGFTLESEVYQRKVDTAFFIIQFNAFYLLEKRYLQKVCFLLEMRCFNGKHCNARISKIGRSRQLERTRFTAYNSS